MEEKISAPSKYPNDSAFQQQRLPAWQPLLTPQMVIGSFLLVSIVFVPIGVGIIVASNNVVEVCFRYDLYQPFYSDLMAYAANSSALASPPCNFLIDQNGNQIPFDANLIASLPTTNANIDPDFSSVLRTNVPNCFQAFDIVIPSRMTAPVYFYYRLSNYYQNHRRYTKSRSDYQLEGDSSPDLSGCDPLTSGSGGATLYPCGLIASSFFNDTFGASVNRAGAGGAEQWVLLGNNTATMPGGAYVQSDNWNKQNIAWETDITTKYMTNTDTTSSIASSASSYTPSFTRVSGLGGYPMPLPVDEDLMVWMRTAGLPTFKKLYRKIENTDLNAGDVVRVFVNNVYNVSSFSGSKSIVFSTVSALGGKNTFLGWAFIVVGIICATLSGIFGVKHKVSPRAQGDMKYFTWQGQGSMQHITANGGGKLPPLPAIQRQGSMGGGGESTAPERGSTGNGGKSGSFLNRGS